MPIDWLDPETQSILYRQDPGADTAKGTQSFSLLLVRAGDDRARALAAVEMIQRLGGFNDTTIETVVAQGLTLRQALGGQFALSSCDCISLLVRDTIVNTGDHAYLDQLGNEVALSDEFLKVAVSLLHIPDTAEVREYCWQFFGMAVVPRVPHNISVFKKKARLMTHWAAKCGIRMERNTNP